MKDPSQWEEEGGQLDLPGFRSRNSKSIREPEIFSFAKALRTRYKRIAAIGFC